VLDLPDSATFSATFADPRTYLAMGVSFLAGLVRGFSGFGAALIFVPLVSALYDPRTAAGTFLLIDFAVGLAVLPTAWRVADWREVFPIAAAAAVAAQFGALILIYSVGGAIQIVGPPVIVYWLGSASSPAMVRANLNAFFSLFACAVFVTYIARGLLPSHVIVLALLLGPVQLIALRVGSRLFGRASADTYRRIAYLIVATAALASMPVLDGFLR
jgi:uncharacterized membrane protein YfcA